MIGQLSSGTRTWPWPVSKLRRLNTASVEHMGRSAGSEGDVALLRPKWPARRLRQPRRSMSIGSTRLRWGGASDAVAMSASWSVHHEAALVVTVEHPPLRAAPPTSPGNDSDRQKARDGSNGTFLRWDCQLAISAVTKSTSVRAGRCFRRRCCHGHAAP